MEGGEASTFGICSRLYNFFARHFTSQSAKLVTLGRRGEYQAVPSGAAQDAAVVDVRTVAVVPLLDVSAAGGGTGRKARDISVGSVKKEEGGKPPDINERCDAFIRSRKEALQTHAVQPPSRPRQPPTRQ